MKNLDRRQLLHAGVALAVPFAVSTGSTALPGQQQSTDEKTKSDSKTNKSIKQNKKEKAMQIQYLEIVTPKVEELCKQYSAIHGVKFSDPIAGFGNARTAKLSSGGLIGIRGPLRPDEKPVVRPYVLVENLEKAVAAAKDSGAEIAIPKMELPGGHGTIAIVIQGGIDCGLWQN